MQNRRPLGTFCMVFSLKSDFHSYVWCSVRSWEKKIEVVPQPAFVIFTRFLQKKHFALGRRQSRGEGSLATYPSLQAYYRGPIRRLELLNAHFDPLTTY